MEMISTLVNLSHEDIVNILSGAHDGNPALYLNAEDDEYAKAEGDTFEDKLAWLWEHGRRIWFVDTYAEGDNNSKLFHNELTKRYEDSTKKERDNADVMFDRDGCAVFMLSMHTFINNLNYVMHEQGEDGKLCRELLQDIINEDDDMYTNYNLVQYAIFGEEVYG